MCLKAQYNFKIYRPWSRRLLRIEEMYFFHSNKTRVNKSEFRGRERGDGNRYVLYMYLIRIRVYTSCPLRHFGHHTLSKYVLAWGNRLTAAARRPKTRTNHMPATHTHTHSHWNIKFKYLDKSTHKHKVKSKFGRKRYGSVFKRQTSHPRHRGWEIVARVVCELVFLYVWPER